MIDYRGIEEIVVNGLSEYLGCQVIMANQSSPIPAYPYVAYTIITPLVARGGTYGYDGVYKKQLNQIWSISVHSSDHTECSNKALSMYDYFEQSGQAYLSDNNISVIRVSNITNRDNLISSEYEYIQGLDVTIGLMHEIEDRHEIEGQEEYIANVTIPGKIDGKEYLARIQSEE